MVDELLRLDEDALWLNDRGEVLDEPMLMINRYYKPGEELEAFMACEYANDNRGIPFRPPPTPPRPKHRRASQQGRAHLPRNPSPMRGYRAKPGPGEKTLYCGRAFD